MFGKTAQIPLSVSPTRFRWYRKYTFCPVGLTAPPPEAFIIHRFCVPGGALACASLMPDTGSPTEIKETLVQLEPLVRQHPKGSLVLRELALPSKRAKSEGLF